VVGDSALNAAVAVIWPVPPLDIARDDVHPILYECVIPDETIFIVTFVSLDDVSVCISDTNPFSEYVAGVQLDPFHCSKLFVDGVADEMVNPNSLVASMVFPPEESKVLFVSVCVKF
jgi:hypothetical protein